MLDLNLARLAKSEYEERLRTAELYRRIRAVQAGQPSWLDSFLLRLSQLLISLGNQLRQRVEMRLELN
jgi:hypothetical protein